MTYRGSIRNGVVVFEEPVPLAEGTAVEVEPVDNVAAEPLPTPGTPEAMKLLDGIKWAGDPDELHRLLKEVQEMRDADLAPLEPRVSLDKK